MSQEVELRLRRSLEELHPAEKIHDAFGGAPTFTIFLMAAECVQAVQIATGTSWLDNPFLHSKAVEIVTAMMREFRPPGPEVRPKHFNPGREKLPDEYIVNATVLGHLRQMHFTRDEASLGRLKNQQGGFEHFGEIAHRAPTKRRLLGTYAKRINSPSSFDGEENNDKGDCDAG